METLADRWFTANRKQKRKNMQLKAFPEGMFLSLFGCLLASNAHAGESVLTKDYTNCLDNSGRVTVEMVNCISSEIERQDGRLNAIYKSLLAELPAERQKKLREAQRFWLKYRDANCNFFIYPEGGTLEVVTANDCVLRMTADRATELEKLSQQ